MPEWFVLEVEGADGRWIAHGRYRGAGFDRRADGTYVCVPEAGTPIYLRCLRQSGNLIEVVDGTGKRLTYRLRPFAGHRHRASDDSDMSPSHGKASPRLSAG